MRLALVSLAILVFFGGLRSAESELYGDPPTGPAGKLLQQLPVGGAVAVTDKGDAFELTVWENKLKPLGYVVVEVNADFVRLRDNAGISDRLIPWWSVKSLTIMRQPAGIMP